MWQQRRFGPARREFRRASGFKPAARKGAELETNLLKRHADEFRRPDDADGEASGARRGGDRWGAGIAARHATLQKDAYWNLPSGVTSLSHDEYFLHMMAFWVCVVIGIGVFGAMFYSVFAHRRSRHPKPATFHENTTIEVLWTVIPFLILIGMATPAVATLIKSYNTTHADLTIKVTGYQWMWGYSYPEQGIKFLSRLTDPSLKAAALGSKVSPDSVPNYLRNVTQDMVVPVNQRVRLLITSGDVDHGWWVEDLGIKRNAYPGFINDVWFKADRIGTYNGQCTVLCGYGHGYMPIVVRVVSQADFDAWAKKMKDDGFSYQPSKAALAVVAGDQDAQALASGQSEPEPGTLHRAPASATSAQ
jgi:cytochrome c oxidase, subunit II